LVREIVAFQGSSRLRTASMREQPDRALVAFLRAIAVAGLCLLTLWRARGGEACRVDALGQHLLDTLGRDRPSTAKRVVSMLWVNTFATRSRRATAV
jgi:hypothetical protein